MKLILPTIAILVTSTIFRTPLLQYLTAFSTWYMMCLDTNPLITKCIMGGIVALLGDYGVIMVHNYLNTLRHHQQLFPQQQSQNKNRQRREWHCVRLGSSMWYRSFLECLLISTPLMHMGYDYFEHILPIAAGSAGIYKNLATLSHVVADSVWIDGISVGTAIILLSVGRTFLTSICLA